MKVIYDQGKACAKKTLFEQKIKLATEHLHLEKRINLLRELGWAISAAGLSYLAIFYGVVAGKTAVAVLCVLLNLLVPIYKIVTAAYDYILFQKFLKTDFQKDMTPAMVLYHDALETTGNVDIVLEFDPTPSLAQKCRVLIDTQSDKKPLIGEFPVIIDPTVSEETVDLENEVVLVPVQDAEFHKDEVKE